MTPARPAAGRGRRVVPALPAGPRSLKGRLLGMWCLSLLACMSVGVLLLQLYRQSTDAQVGAAAMALARGCGAIRDGYWRHGPAPGAADPSAVVAAALAGEPGVEGGLWEAGAGPRAYAFPTYEGGPKTDLPAAERDRIAAVNEAAAARGRPVEQRARARSQTLLLRACPLGAPPPGLTAWTMTRVHRAQGLRPLGLGLGALLAVVAAMSALLGRTLAAWGRHVRGIEDTLRTAGAGDMPAVARTGERELDRIIDALNEAGRRLGEARAQADAAAARAARAEHLAGLGRIAAGVAHEIRNPLAAARLQGENALAGDDGRRREAIGDMLGQIGRLDALVGELLAMTQRTEPRPVRVALDAFLADRAARHRETAAARRISLEARGAGGDAVLDPEVVGRILDNLLSNAIRHAPERGAVLLSALRPPGLLVLMVEDTGPGVAPDLAGRLFEPFVTGRADGTGLGLAIARELADAHGGRLRLARGGGGPDGTAFALELPREEPRDGFREEPGDRLRDGLRGKPRGEPQGTPQGTPQWELQGTPRGEDAWPPS